MLKNLKKFYDDKHFIREVEHTHPTQKESQTFLA